MLMFINSILLGLASWGVWCGCDPSNAVAPEIAVEKLCTGTIVTGKAGEFDRPASIRTVAALRQGSERTPTPTLDGNDGEDRFDLKASLAERGLELSEVKRIVKRAFERTHQGYSSDEVLLDDAFNEAFLAECQKQEPKLRPIECNWILLNLRKAGRLSSIPTTRRRSSDTEAVLPVAEVAARSTLDQHPVSVDQMLADPELRQAFERRVRELAPQADLYLARKAVFRLRKSRRLQPELITRIADWDRQIQRLTVEQIRADFSRVPEQPGIYIFRDASGYLYIGQSENLRTRMESHLSESSSASLAQYLSQQPADQIQVELHVFPRDSRMKETRIRRAYESELIRSRKPRFNILP